MVHLTTALDASSGVPLYEQLYRSLAREMRSGTLAAAPDARQAAAGGRAVRLGEYGGCRLSDAGGGRYLESRERSGFYVQEYLALRPGLPAGRNSPHRQNRNRLCCRCGTTFPPAG